MQQLLSAISRLSFLFPRAFLSPKAILSRTASLARSKWQNAQSEELKWWQGVSQTGYGGESAENFVASHQKKWLLSQLEFLGKPLDSWKDGVVVEFGSGPAGFVEYIQARERIGIEPLIDEYRKVFPHLQKSSVSYHKCSGEDAKTIASDIADLLICFNVLDHVYDPESLLKNLRRVGKTGADVLFQVNLYLNAEEVGLKSGLHAELHPHSFYPETIKHLLQTNGIEVLKEHCSKEVNDCGEHYYICAGRCV